jgi:GntR family transcriptional regulator of arabinose operon
MNSFPKAKPLFESVAELLRNRIDAGEWQFGNRLPVESELAEQYSVGVNTLRRAVDMLVSDGIITRRQGSGTYVAVRRVGRERRFLGVVVPSTSYYFPSVIAGIERVTGAAGMKLLLASSDYDPELEQLRIRELIETGVAGLIVAPTLHFGDAEQHLDMIRALRIPTVLIERRPANPSPDDPLSYVCTDAVGGAYAAVRHLAEQGRTRIGFLGRSDTATADQVYDGYRRAVADLGLTRIPASVVRKPTWGAAELHQYAELVRSENLDGVFCLGDREGTGLLSQLRGVDMSVPEDLAIVAYDDEVADVAEVPLSAVSPPKSEVGRLAATSLLRLIELGDAASPIRIMLQPGITIRKSSIHARNATLAEVDVAEPTVADAQLAPPP